MRGKTIIAPTTAAVNKILIVDNLNLNGSLSIVGAPAAIVVAVQVPIVENPVEATDNNWTALVYEGTAVVLDANNNSQGIPFRGTYRIAKPESVGNAFGIKFE